LFPVWTPSQTHTTVIVIDLCGVNGLVAVHWPNLRKTKVQDDTTIQQKNNDNLPSSLHCLNKRPNISSFRPMSYMSSHP
jgi:hypothetical protein